MNNDDDQSFEQPHTDVTTGRAGGRWAPSRWLMTLGLGLCLGTVGCLGDPDAVDLDDVVDQDVETRVSATKVTRPGTGWGAVCQATSPNHQGTGIVDQNGFCCWTEKRRGSNFTNYVCVECGGTPNTCTYPNATSIRGDLSNAITSDAGSLGLAR